LAELCFPAEDISGDSGHEGKDVMYVAFVGADAVPGALGAAWTAKSAAEFENSIKSLGDMLVAGLEQDTTSSTATPTASTPASTSSTPTPTAQKSGVDPLPRLPWPVLLAILIK